MKVFAARTKNYPVSPNIKTAIITIKNYQKRMSRSRKKNYVLKAIIFIEPTYIIKVDILSRAPTFSSNKTNPNQ